MSLKHFYRNAGENVDGKEFLMRLSEVPGGSGDERNVGKFLIEHTKNLVDSATVDAIGNVVLFRQGTGQINGPKVMIAAHMDEITLMVQKIDQGGFLRVVQVGGFDPRTLLGQEVVVHGQTGNYVGVIGAKPPHLSTPEERKKTVPLQDLFVDVAMPETMVQACIQVGDRITIRRTCMPLLNERLAGKAMDNRASVTALMVCLQELQGKHTQADVYAVGTVQEEIGSKGAQTAAFAIMPDVAIAVDVCHGETPGVASDLVQEIGGGPVLSFGPNIHPKIFTRLKEIAKQHGIAVQVEVTQGATWTDADPMQIVQAGIATGLISIALRYMHTSVETLSYDDVHQVGKLLARFIESLDHAFVEGLTCYLNN